MVFVQIFESVQYKRSDLAFFLNGRNLRIHWTRNSPEVFFSLFFIFFLAKTKAGALWISGALVSPIMC